MPRGVGVRVPSAALKAGDLLYRRVDRLLLFYTWRAICLVNALPWLTFVPERTKDKGVLALGELR